jgi:hypothetical protein
VSKDTVRAQKDLEHDDTPHIWQRSLSWIERNIVHVHYLHDEMYYIASLASLHMWRCNVRMVPDRLDSSNAVLPYTCCIALYNEQPFARRNLPTNQPRTQVLNAQGNRQG